MPARTHGLLCLLLIAASSSAAHAQACIGIPTSSGRVALGAVAEASGDGKGAGLMLDIDFALPAIARGRGLATFLDGGGTATEWSALVGARLSSAGLSVCPMAGVERTVWSFVKPLATDERSADPRSTGIPIGIGLGVERASTLADAISLYALPQLVILRSVNTSRVVSDASRTTVFRIEAGLGAAKGRGFMKLFSTFASGDEPAVMVGAAAGILLGRREHES